MAASLLQWDIIWFSDSVMKLCQSSVRRGVSLSLLKLHQLDFWKDILRILVHWSGPW